MCACVCVCVCVTWHTGVSSLTRKQTWAPSLGNVDSATGPPGRSQTFLAEDRHKELDTAERLSLSLGFPVAQLVKNPPAVRETWVRCLGWEDPLEKGKATHPSILAWRIPWTV